MTLKGRRYYLSYHDKELVGLNNTSCKRKELNVRVQLFIMIEKKFGQHVRSQLRRTGIAARKGREFVGISRRFRRKEDFYNDRSN